MNDKDTFLCRAVTEICQAKTQTFYNVIEDNMVYVTITVQKLPEKVQGKAKGDGRKSVREYVAFLAESLDYVDIGQLIV